jgi:hypothetical protein
MLHAITYATCMRCALDQAARQCTANPPKQYIRQNVCPVLSHVLVFQRDMSDMSMCDMCDNVTLTIRMIYYFGGFVSSRQPASSSLAAVAARQRHQAPRSARGVARPTRRNARPRTCLHPAQHARRGTHAGLACWPCSQPRAGLRSCAGAGAGARAPHA